MALFDMVTYASEGLEKKPYGWWFVAYDMQEYLQTNYPKVNYTNNYTYNYFNTEDNEVE
jgi:hypothetical protein